MRWVITIALLTMCFGCTRTIYMPKETLRTEYIDRIKVDSVYQRDSVYLYERGDTVYKYIDRYLTKYVYQRDTIIRVDSVSYPVIVPDVQIKKHVPKFFWFCFIVTLAVAGFGAWKLYRKIMK